MGVLAFPALAQTTPTPEPGAAREIAFTAVKVGETQTDIYLLNVDTGEMRNLTNSPETENGLAWSPDGMWLAYTAQLQESNSNGLYILNMKSGEKRVIVKTAVRDIPPMWMPEGDQIIYLTSEGEKSALNIINTDATQPRQLLLEDEIGTIDLSFDGTQLVLQMGGGLGVFNLTNETLQPLIQIPEDERLYNDASWPKWSPDGQQIAYLYLESMYGPYEIYLINGDGSNNHRFVKEDYGTTKPVWWPDGSKIMYVAEICGVQCFGHNAIYIRGVNGGQLTILGSDVSFPSVSPDGSKIVYHDFSASHNLAVMNADGTHARLLTNGIFEKFDDMFWDFAWRPVPAGE
ncbi:MAG TPA: hypothetical protein VHO69_19085 [Phototrophicaceae bacterium]|nr:hypothetical protein [Phototrophicaceae bacterium]